MDAVGAFALMPWWLRVVLFYLLGGLVLSLYKEQRAAGKTVGEALLGILRAGLLAPVDALRSLYAAWKGKAIVILFALAAACCLACTSIAAEASKCPEGKCPLATLSPLPKVNTPKGEELLQILDAISTPEKGSKPCPHKRGWRPLRRK